MARTKKEALDKFDRLSRYVGAFDTECYLIGRGVRYMGETSYLLEDYDKLKSTFELIAKAQGVLLETRQHKAKKGYIIVNIIIYHPTKGKKYVNRLRAIMKDRDKYNHIKGGENLFKKLLKTKEKLTGEEKGLLKEICNHSREMERELGRVYGYDEDEIKKYMTK